MKKLIFASIFLVLWHVQVQAQAQAHAQQDALLGKEPTAKLDKAAIEEEAQRILYAKELMNVMGFEQIIKQSVDQAEDAFKNQNESSDETLKKNMAAGQVKYDAIKEKLPQQIHDRLLKELTVRYNTLELKYLIDINKYSLNQKFKAFMNSEDYNSIINKPFSEARNILSEGKRKIASEPARRSGKQPGKGK